MKIIIAGSRDINNKSVIQKTIWESPFSITEVVCGEARGVDTLGKEWAIENSIPVKSFKPDWNKYALKAGFIRNAEMADYADGAIVIMFSKGTSGSKNMIQQMRKRNKPCFIKLIEERNKDA